MSHLLVVRKLTKKYRRGGGILSESQGGTDFTAVDEVSFEVATGETFAIVGESGCGKTTLARMLLRLIESDAGEILFQGKNILQLSAEGMRAERRQMQMIFQDPFASLNPRMKVGEIVGEPLAIHEGKIGKAERTTRVAEALRRVGLDEGALQRYPHEFSGGQRQRIGDRAGADFAAEADCGGRASIGAGRVGGCPSAFTAAGTSAGIRADVHLHFAQFAGGGATGDAHRGDASRAICRMWRRRTDPAPSASGLYKGVASGGPGDSAGCE